MRRSMRAKIRTDDGQRLKKKEGKDFGKSADNDEWQTHKS